MPARNLGTRKVIFIPAPTLVSTTRPKLSPNADRIRNIAHLGVTTYGWTFKNRKMEPPGPPPFVRLTAPSGAVWEWNDSDPGDSVIGSAEEFCQVVTQTRSLADTSLNIVGETAGQWMSIAQCFAGQPENPPEPGTRFRV